MSQDQQVPHAAPTIDDGYGRVLTALTETRAPDGQTRLVLDELVHPGAAPVPAHLHLHQTESFTVVAGCAAIQAGGQTRLLRAGEHLVVTPGTPHTYWNGGDGPLRLRAELTPALEHRRFFESVYGLGRSGVQLGQGGAGRLLGARLLFEHRNWLAGPPIAVQRLLFGLLTLLSRGLGQRVWRPEYHLQADDPAARSGHPA